MPGVAGPTLIQGSSASTHGGSASAHGGSALAHGGSASVHGGSALVHGGSASTHSGLTSTPSLSQASSIDPPVVVSGQDLPTDNTPGLHHLFVCLYVY